MKLTTNILRIDLDSKEVKEAVTEYLKRKLEFSDEINLRLASGFSVSFVNTIPNGYAGPIKPGAKVDIFLGEHKTLETDPELPDPNNK